MDIFVKIFGLILFVLLVLMVSSICRRFFYRVSDIWNRIDRNLFK